MFWMFFLGGPARLPYHTLRYHVKEMNRRHPWAHGKWLINRAACVPPIQIFCYKIYDHKIPIHKNRTQHWLMTTFLRTIKMRFLCAFFSFSLSLFHYLLFRLIFWLFFIPFFFEQIKINSMDCFALFQSSTWSSAIRSEYILSVLLQSDRF